MHDSGVIEYRRVNGVPSVQMPEVYRSADIVLDQFRLGSYGVAACEAMAAGRVVVGHVTDENRSRVKKSTGQSLPIVESTAADLESVLLDIIHDAEGSRAIARAGAAYVAEVHGGRFSASVLEELFRS
jgi:glycosyltransferase involved in cell wall biosynthesis